MVPCGGHELTHPSEAPADAAGGLLVPTTHRRRRSGRAQSLSRGHSLSHSLGHAASATVSTWLSLLVLSHSEKLI